MADRAQLLNDSEEALRLAFDSFQATVWTAMPAVVQSVDLMAMTCEAQPAIQGLVEDENGATQNVDLPLLVDVPIIFPSAGGFSLTFPIEAGDEVLVVMASRCIDAWWQSGGIQRPMEARMHDLSDGFAIPGPRSQPNVLTGGIKTTGVQLRNDGGGVFFQIGTSNKFKMVNATKSLKGVLNGELDLLTQLNTAVAAFAAAVAGGTPPIAAAPALVAATTAIGAAIIAFQTADVGGLLE